MKKLRLVVALVSLLALNGCFIDSLWDDHNSHNDPPPSQKAPAQNPPTVKK